MAHIQRPAGLLAKVVHKAEEIFVGGEVVLLNPACANYDMFAELIKQLQEEWLGG